MKLRVELADLDEVEVIVRAREITEKVLQIENALRLISDKGTSLALTLGKEEHFVHCEDILFFETDQGKTAAHTADGMYRTSHSLAELEALLPRTFARASKSCIINTARVSSISHNPVSSSEAFFKPSYKRVYISRMYYRSVRQIIEETRIRK